MGDEWDVGRSQSPQEAAKNIAKKGYNGSMAKPVIHISDAEAANDFASVLDRVREGSEVVIEHDARPVAVVRPAEAFRGRLLSESIALAKAHAKALGYEPTLDPDFAADLEEIINSHRKPLDPPAWDRSSIPVCSLQASVGASMCGTFSNVCGSPRGD